MVKASAVKSMFLLNVIINIILVVKKKLNILRKTTKQKNIWHRRLCYIKYVRV